MSTTKSNEKMANTNATKYYLLYSFDDPDEGLKENDYVSTCDIPLKEQNEKDASIEAEAVLLVDYDGGDFASYDTLLSAQVLEVVNSFDVETFVARGQKLFDASKEDRRKRYFELQKQTEELSRLAEEFKDEESVDEDY